MVGLLVWIEFLSFSRIQLSRFYNDTLYCTHCEISNSRKDSKPLIGFFPIRRYAILYILSYFLYLTSFKDEYDLSAASHLEFIKFHLSVFGKSTDNVICLIGDNVSTNKALATLMGKPLVGCASHRFNLAVQQYLLPHELILSRLQSLMVEF